MSRTVSVGVIQRGVGDVVVLLASPGAGTPELQPLHPLPRARAAYGPRRGWEASRYELLRVLVLFVVHVHVELFGVVIPLAEIVLVVGLVVLVLEQRVRIRVGQER